MELGTQDLRTALDVVQEWYDPAGAGPTTPAGLAALSALVGCDVLSLVRTDHVDRRLDDAAVDRPERNLVGADGFAAAVAAHPGFVAHRSGRLRPGTPVALTDVADPAALRRLPLYVDYYRPAGTRDQLLCVVDVRGRTGTALVANRSRPGFTARDRAVVALMVPHLRQASALHAPRSAPDGIPGWATLTPREREVARATADGATDRQVGRRLGISPRTAQKHLEQVYRKLDIRGRAGLAARLSRSA